MKKVRLSDITAALAFVCMCGVVIFPIMAIVTRNKEYILLGATSGLLFIFFGIITANMD